MDLQKYNEWWSYNLDQGLLKELETALDQVQWYPPTEELKKKAGKLRNKYSTSEDIAFYFAHSMKGHLFFNGRIFPIKCGGNNFFKLNHDFHLIGTARLDEPLDTMANVKVDRDFELLVTMQVPLLQVQPTKLSTHIDLKDCLYGILKLEHKHLVLHPHEVYVNEIAYIEKLLDSRDVFDQEYERISSTDNVFDESHRNLHVLNLFSFHLQSNILLKMRGEEYLIVPKEICIIRSSLYSVGYDGNGFVLSVHVSP
jgi:hypothetical protein